MRPLLLSSPTQRQRNLHRQLLQVAAFAIALLACTLSASADRLDDIRKHGALQWGGDQEGGGPYVYPRPDSPNEVMGFEVELASRLANSLKVRAEFIQGQWDNMPDMLRTGKVDVILNGYELTPARLGLMDATIPYYVYRLQLLGRRNDATYRSWESLKAAAGHRGARVGVLTGSAAETYMRQYCGSASRPACEVISYDGNTDTMREVETGKLDATLEDTPIAAFYAPRFPALAPIGEPVSEGYYVAYVQKGQPALLHALNDALIGMIHDGEIEQIYRKYGIWDSAQQQLDGIAQASRFYGYAPNAPGGTQSTAAGTGQPITTGARERGWRVVRDYGAVLLQSAGMTVVLSILSFPLAIALGLLVAIGRLYGPRWLKWPLGAYVEFLRGTPLMLQLYFIFFFLPEAGIRVPAFWTAILGLAVNYSAYESEIYRAGLQAVPRGQMEAALSLGMSRAMALRRIVAPQAVRMVIPPVVSDFIALYKDTSVCSVITIVELTKRFSVLSMSTQATVELMTMTCVLYMLMSYPVALLSHKLEKSLGVGVAVL